MAHGQFAYDLDRLTFGSAVLQAQMFRQDNNLATYLDLRSEPDIKFMPIRLMIPTVLALIITFQLFGLIGLGIGLAICLYTNHRRMERIKAAWRVVSYVGQVGALERWISARYPEGAPYSAQDLHSALSGRIGEIERFYRFAKFGNRG